MKECVRNVEARWNDHNNPTKKQKPSKRLRGNVGHPSFIGQC